MPPVLLPQPGRSGFIVRDVAAGSDFTPLENAGQAPGIKVAGKTSVLSGAEFTEVEVSDLTGKDLYYVLPVGPGQVHWLGSPSAESDCNRPVEFMETKHFNAGAPCAAPSPIAS